MGGTSITTRLTLLLAAMALVVSTFAQTTAPATRPVDPSTALIELSGPIDDYSAGSVIKRINSAKSHGAKNIILAINTWGGQVTSALEISQFLKRQDDLHIVALVTDKAISAGSMIALACDELVMQPGSRIGDCAPITLRSDGSLEALPAAERAKIESPILADFRESARRNGYDPLIAEAMVSVGRIVYYIQDESGARRFVNKEDFTTLSAEGWKTVEGVPVPLDPDSELLTIDAEIAHRIGLSKATIQSADALADERGWSITSRALHGFGDDLVAMLASGIARSILLTIFMSSLYLAMSMPGHGAPEAIALTSLGVLIGIPLLTGYATWWEIVLIFSGLAMIAFEIFVYPGHFVSLIIGFVMMVGGFLMTFVPKEPSGIPGILPQMAGSYDALGRGFVTVTGGVVASIALWFWLSRYLPQLPYFNRLVLATGTLDPAVGAASISTETWPPIGVSGEAQTDLRPGGSAAFYDLHIGDARNVSVICDRGFVRAGTKVQVVEVSGNRIVVRPAATEARA